MQLIIDVATEPDMLKLGAHLAQATANESIIIFLYGDLGAGKTTLVRGFLRGQHYEGHVKSPTYNIVEPYELKDCTVYHFDFYRVQNPQELEYIGIADYFAPHSICLIEWPDHGAEVLPPADLSCYIEPASTGRTVKMTGHSVLGKTILNRLTSHV